MDNLNKTIVRYKDSLSSEIFDEQKLHNDIAHACRSVGSPDGAAINIASHVVNSIKQWLANKSEVTDDDLIYKSSESLQKLCPEAAYIYENQKNII